MPLLHILILALIQGITEFLPISSSGHLVLAWEAFDRASVETQADSESKRLILDIAVHLGTLFAVLLYFRADVARMIAGAWRLLFGHADAGGRLALQVVVATLPLVVAGLLFKDLVTYVLRNPTVVALATIGFGILLYAADRRGTTEVTVERMGYRAALLIGFAQILSLIPGTSRSGITMTAARYLGFRRTEAARFSILLAAPAILGAATLAGFDLYKTGDLALSLDAAIAAVFAFAAALLAIWVMMAWLARATFTPFVIYRVALGLVLLFVIYQDSIRATFG